MNRLLVPWCHTKSIYDIDDSFFLSHHIKYLLTDLDNTLASHLDLEPSEQTQEFKRRLDALGIKMIIISNNSQKRVAKYAQALGVSYIARANKPFLGKVRRYLKNQKIDPNEAIYFGDQVLNDIRFANRLQLRTVLVELLSNEDQIGTRLNRLIDRPLRKKLHKQNLLRNWRETYE